MFLKNYSKLCPTMTSNSIFSNKANFSLPFQSRCILFSNARFVLCPFQPCRCVIDNVEDSLSLAATIRELLDHKVISICSSF